MILRNRLFERTPPNRDAKSIYVFCEGAKRELDYFEYFKELDSRVNVEVYKLHPHENNSPKGLLNIAEDCIIKSEQNPKPKYNFIEGDEVWLVLDIDKDKNESREPQIKELELKCEERDGWCLALSNPCFEVWLYYHFHQSIIKFKNNDKCSSWKQYVNNSIPGGFDSRKHPLFIEKAGKHAKENFKEINQRPTIGSTEVFRLADSLIPLIGDKLDKAIQIK